MCIRGSGYDQPPSQEEVDKSIGREGISHLNFVLACFGKSRNCFIDEHFETIHPKNNPLGSIIRRNPKVEG